MALAAYNIMKARNRTNILIGGVDAMPPAIQAVSEGRMFATVRNPSCRIHGGAIVAGVAAVTAGEKSGQGIPKHRRHRRPGRDQGQRGRHAMDGGSLPDLSPHAQGHSAHPRTARHHEGLRRRRGASWGRLRAFCRRDPWSRRRKRRGQKHADEDHRRRACGFLRPVRARRPGDPLSLGARRACGRHRHGASGTQRRARPDGGRERVSRQPADQPLRPRAMAAHGARGRRAARSGSASTSIRCRGSAICRSACSN